MTTKEVTVKTCDTCGKKETVEQDTYGCARFRDWISITMRNKHTPMPREQHADFCSHNCAVAFLHKENEKK